MTSDDRVFVAGGETLLGAALLRCLIAKGYAKMVAEGNGPSLTDAAEVEQFFATTRPNYVFFAGGPSGGIAANQRYPADLMRDNLLAATHVLSAAHRYGVTKLVYLASSCIYPRLSPQPMREEALWTGPLESTNEAYAAAKLAGLTLCRAYARQYGAHFATAIPANPFGPGDDFRLEEGHVIPSLLARFHEAKTAGRAEVTVWGTGQPRREFLFADDLADACLFVMQAYDDPRPINLGGGEDCSIAELAGVIAEVVGYRGRIVFDPTRPDGMPLKRLDGSRLRSLGWSPMTSLRQGLEATYRWYLRNTHTREPLYAR